MPNTSAIKNPNGVFGLAADVVALQAGTAYTLQFGDAQTVLGMTSASANVVTIPPNATGLFPIGTRITIQQQGTGSTSIAGGSGVTGTAVGAVIGQQSAMLQILQTANNVWDVVTAGSASVLNWPAWTAVLGGVGFQNSFANVGGFSASYRKSGDGKLVGLAGQITGGASGATAFTLPVGYRPVTNKLVAVCDSSSGGFIMLVITPAGLVQPFGGVAGDGRSIDCIFAIDI